VTGTPVVSLGQVFIGDWAGQFYKLRSSDGGVLWTTPVQAPVSASALVQANRVIFGDQGGFIYGLDRASGAIQWQIRPNDHPYAAIFGSPVPVGSSFVLGISSNEEFATEDPTYPCCTFRGSVVKVDSLTGNVLWQTYLISDADYARGASGATVFSSPTYDADLNLIFVSTSNNYSAPATNTSDSFMALDPSDGHVVWRRQLIQNDISTIVVPWVEGLDAGFGDSPSIYRLPNGRKVIGAGSKIGKFYVVDAQTGELLYERKIQTSGTMGGLWESAVSDGIVYAPGIDWADPTFDFDDLPAGGLLTAFTGDTSQVLWQIYTPHSINQGAVAVANNVLFAPSCNPGTGSRIENDVGTLLVVNTFNGNIIKQIPLGHCASSGASVADGKVFVGTGNEYQFSATPPGSVSAIGP
jgi:polyvinyl alcohol dehydrogenase (cytochrome)